MNCSLLHALASVQEVKGGEFTQNYHIDIMNRDTETHLKFSVLFNFLYLINMVITISEDFCLYQGASRKKDAPTYGW